MKTKKTAPHVWWKFKNKKNSARTCYLHCLTFLEKDNQKKIFDISQPYKKSLSLSFFLFPAPKLKQKQAELLK